MLNAKLSTGKRSLAATHASRAHYRPMAIEIRNETAADIRAIEAVTTAAFRHAPHTSHTEQLDSPQPHGTVAYHAAFDEQQPNQL